MGKKLLIPIVLVIVIAIFGGGYFYYTKNSITTSDQSTTKVANVNPDSASSTPSSLRDLLGLGVNQKCTYTDTESGSQGTAYVTSGKMRGDFEVITDDASVNSHTIIDNQTMYVWTDGQSQGYKMSLTQAEEPTITGEPESPATSSEGVDLNAKVDYNCTPWSVDDTVFALPGDVEFQDMNQMMESITGMMENGSDEDTESVKSSSEDQCEYCNSLPDSAKQQCLTSFGC